MNQKQTVSHFISHVPPGLKQKEKGKINISSMKGVKLPIVNGLS